MRLMRVQLDDQSAADVRKMKAHMEEMKGTAREQEVKMLAKQFLVPDGRPMNRDELQAIEEVVSKVGPA
jgi:hypothetical protein